MASTTTSDSEDFESADEDIREEKPQISSLSTGISVPSLKSNCQREVDKQYEKHSGDVKPTIDESVVEKMEAGSGDLPSKQKRTSQVEKLDLPVEEVVKPTISKDKALKDSDSGNDEPPIERRRRQQKQRETKTSRPIVPKKLGTKINVTNEQEDSQTRPNQPQNTDTKSKAESDSYTKFTGYSKPPIMQRCWPSGPDGKTVLDDHEKKISSHEEEITNRSVDPLPSISDVTEKVPDPYAKFRGYSEPPLMEQCWEADVDGEIIVEDTSLSAIEDKRTIPVTNANIAPMFDKLSQAASDKTSSSTWGGWGNWGVTSLLSSATESVSTLTSHVTSVLESGIGAPNPEELARIDRLEEKLMAEMKSPEPPLPQEEKDGGRFDFGSLMKLVETTGSKVLSGGLDTLETIGKKTMEVLQEGDPGLKKKRALFTDKTVLSQILREAKEKAEIDDRETEDQQARRNVHFETLFDDYQGLVHLEALEMLSKQCDMKLQALLLSYSGALLTELQAELQRARDSCQLPDDEDMAEEDDDEDRTRGWEGKLADAEKGLGVPLSTGKLATIWKETTDWLKESGCSEGETKAASTREIHQKAVSTLARLTAVSVEQFHKGAELLLVKEKRSSVAEAEALITITTVLCCQVSTAATRFCELLNDSKESSTPEDVNSLITNIFLEASNSSSYIQEAFQLLIPVLQVGITA